MQDEPSVKRRKRKSKHDWEKNKHKMDKRQNGRKTLQRLEKNEEGRWVVTEIRGF